MPERAHRVAAGPARGSARERGAAALASGFVTAEEFDAWVKPEEMTRPTLAS